MYLKCVGGGYFASGPAHISYLSQKDRKGVNKEASGGGFFPRGWVVMVSQVGSPHPNYWPPGQLFGPIFDPPGVAHYSDPVPLLG